MQNFEYLHDLKVPFFNKKVPKNAKNNQNLGFLSIYAILRPSGSQNLACIYKCPTSTHMSNFKSLGLIVLEIFSFEIFQNFAILDFLPFFLKKNEKYECQFCENGLANSYEVWKINSKVSEGYNDPNRPKNISKLKKQVPKFCIFGHPGIFCNATAKRL